MAVNLKQQIEALELNLPDNFFYNVQKYKEQLFKWNRVHNLTGAKDETSLDGFIVDALFPLTFLPKVSSLLDIGTGAGFPGMILAMALPQTEIFLVEPLSKRASFLQFVTATLQLHNVHVIKKRVEAFDPQKSIELITSRAVTQTDMLLRLSAHLRNANSLLLFYKGENVFTEVQKLPKNFNYKVIEEKNRHYLLLGENL
jgi:16S rRNA (guanine527-N7)-methyltransferase